MKIKAVEEAKQLYNVVYDLPDSLVAELDKIREKGGMRSIRDFLEENAEVVSSEQCGEAYEFKPLKFEKGEDKAMANTYRTELVFNKEFKVPYYEDVESSIDKVIKERHNVNVKKCANGENSFIVFADAPMRSSQVYDILDALGYHETKDVKVYCEDDVDDYYRSFKVVATEKGWRVR